MRNSLQKFDKKLILYNVDEKIFGWDIEILDNHDAIVTREKLVSSTRIYI